MSRTGIAVAVMAMAALTARAQMEPTQGASDLGGWQVELTPYAWLAGIDADVTVAGQKAKVDQSFSDIVKHVDLAGALMMVADHDRWEVFAQGDYFSLSDSGTGPRGNDVTVDSDTYILTGGAGYRFDGPIKGSKIAVLGGARYTRLENQIKATGVGAGKRDTDIADALLMLRPSIPIVDNLRFNPTINIGAGDSDLTYELQPELQYNFTDLVAGRIGYRRVYYKEKNDNGNEFDGSFTGFLIGLGVIL